MLEFNKHDERIECSLSSEPAIVELLARLLQDTLTYEGVRQTPSLVVAARELMMNAAIHGNGGDPQKKVVLRLDCSHKPDFIMTVRDEGGGFDYHALDMSMPADPARTGPRGYAIIRSLARDIAFSENGASVTVRV
jgi:anti-sigma regulatory factor (Ser/Thr protein kinase)